MVSLQESVLQAAMQAKTASSVLADATANQRNNVLSFAAQNIAAASAQILEANKQDVERATKLFEQGQLAQTLLSRLKLDQAKLTGIIDGINAVAQLEDPLGIVTLARELDEGLNLYRVTCPIGVVAVIFESRPDALPQIFSLCVKSGNAVILKGGKEAAATNKAMFGCVQKALEQAGLPAEAAALLEGREAIEVLLKADSYVDLVIPRGSNELVRHIQSNTRIPVLGHADGLCHIYVDEKADLSIAEKVVVDAKVQYPAACNSIETLLLHRTIAKQALDALVPKLQAQKVELRLDADSREIVNPDVSHNVKAAADEDWSTEYSDLILSIKLVDSVDEAIKHINGYGSHHTDAIITAEKNTFDRFFARVNSAGVFWNASTRFADGFRYGFGAEVGISTGKLHPRGPVGLEGIVTYKYKLLGKGHIVADYSGDNAKKFTHKKLD